MYNIGHTFFDKLYHLEFRIIKEFEAYRMYFCETVTPNKDIHGMEIKLFCYFSETYIHDCNDYK